MYSNPCQISKMEIFTKIIVGVNILICLNTFLLKWISNFETNKNISKLEYFGVLKLRFLLEFNFEIIWSLFTNGWHENISVVHSPPLYSPKVFFLKKEHWVSSKFTGSYKKVLMGFSSDNRPSDALLLFYLFFFIVSVFVFR